MTAAELFDANRGLAYLALRGLRPNRRTSLAAMRQAALLGLWHAARRYNAGRGVRFSTYAVRCCRGFVLTALGARPTRTDRLLAAAVRGDLAAGDGRPLFEAVADRRAGDPAGLAEERDDADHLAERVRAALRRLPPRLAAVARGRLMEGRTLAAVGAELGVTKERVRQLEGKAVARLRQALA